MDLSSQYRTVYATAAAFAISFIVLNVLLSHIVDMISTSERVKPWDMKKMHANLSIRNTSRNRKNLNMAKDLNVSNSGNLSQNQESSINIYTDYDKNQDKTKPLENITTFTNNISTETLVRPIFITGFLRDWIHNQDVNLSSCLNLRHNESCRYISWDMNNDLNIYEAVIFRPFDLRHPYDMNTHLKHPAHQKWVFYEWEAPFRTWTDDSMKLEFWSEMNITMTFMQDSDLVYYRYAYQCDTHLHWTHSKENYAKDKTGNILWIVSNCHHTSGREHYVSELQKHIPVDIYGKCGNRSICSTSGAYGACVNNLIMSYRFYLAFENSFCEGYYTEKLTRLFPLPVVPVVMGLVNYSSLLPVGSYIDIRDYRSPQALAEYLKYLSHNDTAYNAYIDKKRAVTCDPKYNNEFLCVLCEYLHQHRGQVQTSKDARDFFGVKRRCTSLKEMLDQNV